MSIHLAFKMYVRSLYNSDSQNFAKLDSQLTMKNCFPSNIVRQNVTLVLKVINELIRATLEYQNELSEYRKNTSNFVGILLALSKIFNANTPFKR